ncbi:MAG: DUF4118 domain-containing protein [Candidatus Promineifilaceae bacterium]|nr:DUF4118 domain-containing protein [Anaerolineaceae bacterium]
MIFKGSPRIRTLLSSLVAVGLVFLVTLPLWRIRDALTLANFTLIYLLLTLVVAAWLGTTPSLIAAFVSFFCFNFFLIRPYYTLTVKDPRELIDLFITSYADFPRLAALHAGDGFLPRQLTYRGGRLVFNWGIITLAVMASLLVIVMNARTTALIPLYAIGVFLSFTISQSGMVVRLRKIGRLLPGEKVQGLETVMEYDRHWRWKMVISAFGAVCTGIVMLIFAITKFTSGAWFVIALIPVLVFAFFRVHHHYKAVARNLHLDGHHYDITTHPVQTLVLVDGVHSGTLELVNFAKSLNHPWHAVHIGINPEKASKVMAQWNAIIGEGTLVVVPSPYRQLNLPIRTYVEKLLLENPDTIIHVVVGHLAMETAWEQMLHQNSVLIFNLALNSLERVVLTIVPHQIRHKENNGHPVDQNLFKADEMR